MSAAVSLILLSAWIEAAGLGLLALVFAGRLPGRGWPERLGLGYMLGLGAVCWLSFVWMFCGLKFNLAGIVCLTLPVIAGGGWLAWHGSGPFTQRYLSDESVKSDVSNRNEMRSITRVAWLTLAAVCAIAVIYQTIYLMHMPLHGWDALHLWAYKTEILMHLGAVWTEEYTDPAITNTPRTYPHFLPIAQMLHAGAAGPLIEGGAWKFFFGLLQGAFVAVFYGMARRRLGPLAAMAFTAMIATMPHFSNIEDGGPVSGYADVMLAVYYFLAAAALWRWLEEGGRSWLIIGAIATAFCYFTKREGLLPVILNSAAVLLLTGGWSWRGAGRRKLMAAFNFSAAAGAMILPVWLFARAVEANPDLVGSMLRSLEWSWFVERRARFWYAAGMTVKYLFFNPHTWALAWWGVAALAILRFRAAMRPGAIYLLLAAALPVIIFCIVAVVTTFHLEGLMLITFPRIVQITIGPVFFFLAVMLAPWLTPSEMD